MGKTVVPPPPSGFTVVNNVPPPPAGFVLEEPEKKERDFLDKTADIFKLAAVASPGGGVSMPGLPQEQEQIRQTGREALPVVGATIGSVMAPPLALPAALSRLGAVGKVAAPFVENAPSILGAFTGGAVGGAGRAATAEGPVTAGDVASEALEAGLREGVGETVGVGAGALLSKVLAPFGKALSDKTQDVMAFAKEKNIPLPPSASRPSLAAKAIEGGTDAFLPSRLVNDRYRKVAVVRFNQLMTEIPQEVGPLKGNDEIAQETLREFQRIFTGKEAEGKRLADEFLQGIGHNTEVPVTKTLETLKEIQKNAADPSLREFVQTKLQTTFADAKAITASDLETTLRQVGKVKPKGDTKFLEKLRNAIKADFGEAGADMSKLAGSNEAFKENIGLLASQTAKQLKAASAKGFTPPALTVKIFKSGNEGFVKALEKELSPEVWDSLRAQNLANMIDNAATESKRMLGLKVIDGDKLEKIIKNNRSVLEVAYKNNPETLKALDNLAALAKASKGNLAQFEKGLSSNAFTGNLALGGGAAYADPVMLVAGSTGSMLLAKSMMKGTMNKWLTTGFKVGENTKQGLRMGGRMVFNNGDE